MNEHEPQVKVVTAGLTPARLDAAILLYGENSPLYARMHPVRVVDGRPEILADGHPLTTEGLLEACSALLGKSAPIQFLDPNVLVMQSGFQAWWRAPGPARVLINSPELGRHQGTTVPMPGLVFVNRGSEVRIVAVKGVLRPKPADPVFVAPLFNHYESAQVCNGSVRFEHGMTSAEVERLYWRSWFTSPNQRRVHTLHRDGFYALWRDLLKGRWKRFPESTLASFPGASTLMDFLKGCYDR